MQAPAQSVASSRLCALCPLEQQWLYHPPCCPGSLLSLGLKELLPTLLFSVGICGQPVAQDTPEWANRPEGVDTGKTTQSTPALGASGSQLDLLWKSPSHQTRDAEQELPPMSRDRGPGGSGSVVSSETSRSAFGLWKGKAGLLISLREGALTVLEAV